MLTDENLFLAVRAASKNGQRLPTLLLLSHTEQPAQTMKVRDKGIKVGFRAASQWNLSAVLKNASEDGLVAQLSNGWKLLAPGFQAIDDYYRPEAPLIAESKHALKAHIAKVANSQRRLFIEEAIKCFDVGAHRAAIVLSWVGAAHILEEHIVASHLPAFNSAGLKLAAKAPLKSAASKFTPIKTIKDFGVIGEANILQLAQDGGILHKAEKQILQERLDLRNQCGHPNPIQVAEHVVAAHIEILMLNVYSKF